MNESTDHIGGVEVLDGRRLRIGISGSYGGMNLGDEAILASILAQIRRVLKADVTVFSKNVEDTMRRHKVERVVPVKELGRDASRKEVEGLDLFVLGGGGILYDEHAEAYLREVNLAHELGVPVLVYAVSAGPLNDPGVRENVASALNRAAVVTVRDRLGQRLLEDVGVHREIVLTADPALLLEPEPLPEDALAREGLDPDSRLVGFSVREPGPAAPDIDSEHYHALLANAADFMVDRLGAHIVFVPMERTKMDMQHSHAVVAQMQRADRATVLKIEYTPSQMISLIQHFEFSIGMRLHFLIFSALAGVPFVPLPYAQKVEALVEDLEIEMHPMEHVNTGHLIAAIDRSWDHRAEIQEKITQRLPALQERARRTNEILVELVTLHANTATSQS